MFLFNFSILMIGPTGSGKTEIARRLSKLTDSPYIKVLIIQLFNLEIYELTLNSKKIIYIEFSYYLFYFIH